MLHNEELSDLNKSARNTRTAKSRKLRWDGHEARKHITVYGILVRKHTGKCPLWKIRRWEN